MRPHTPVSNIHCGISSALAARSDVSPHRTTICSWQILARWTHTVRPNHGCQRYRTSLDSVLWVFRCWVVQRWTTTQRAGPQRTWPSPWIDAATGGRCSASMDAGCARARKARAGRIAPRVLVGGDSCVLVVAPRLATEPFAIPTQPFKVSVTRRQTRFLRSTGASSPLHINRSTFAGRSRCGIRASCQPPSDPRRTTRRCRSGAQRCATAGPRSPRAPVYPLRRAQMHGPAGPANGSPQPRVRKWRIGKIS
jgi:hypothetical protein